MSQVGIVDALLIWWLAIQVLGLAALPLTRYIFRWLPDEGYAFTKPLGLLLCSYALWIGASFGILDNVRPTIIVIVVLLALVSWLVFGRRTKGFGDWWRRERSTIVVVELLFTVGLVAMALLRAYSPDISATEKPMEFAFLNAILRSDRFPPVDPWLSGNSISYYYFGYVMVAFLTKLAGLASNYTFNLAIATIFSFTLTGAYGVVSNLIRLTPGVGAVGRQKAAVFGGLLGGGLLAVLGNLEAVVEWLNSAGAIPANVLTWLNIQGLPAPGTGAWPGADWWWFRASRVVGDFSAITGVTSDYTINEFPFFSFLLGDLHSHVLALPFVILCLALALNLLAARGRVSLGDLLFSQRVDLLVLMLAFGGLAFLNTWDLPTYLLVLVVVFAIKKYLPVGTFLLAQLIETGLFAVVVFVGGVIMYLPLFMTLSSQAQGIGLVPVHTKWPQFLIFWGPFIVLVVLFLFAQLRRDRDELPSSASGWRGWISPWWLVIPFVAVGLVLHLEVLAIAVAATLAAITVLRHLLVATPELAVVTRHGLLAAAGEGDVVVGEEFVQSATLVDEPMTGVKGGAATQRGEGAAPWGNPGDQLARSLPLVFALVLITVSLVLLAGSEVVFLRDLFGNRMNTVFKLYYQAWAMLALASAYVLYYLASRWAGWRGGVSRFIGRLAVYVFVLLCLSCLVYPLASAFSRSDGFVGSPNFDGTAYLRRLSSADYESIAWLQQSVAGTPVILETVGESYSQFARISVNTGLPTVVGWPGHEAQWRGQGDEAARREADVATIYRTSDVQVAQQLLRQYGVTYVYVGDLERKTYGSEVGLKKFASFMDVVYQNSGAIIYRVRSQ